MASMVGVGLHRTCAALLVAALALFNVGPCLCAPAKAQSTHCDLRPQAAVAAHHCDSAQPASSRLRAGDARCCCASSEQPQPLAETVLPAAGWATVQVPAVLPAFSAQLSALAPTSNIAAAPAQSPPLVLRI